MTKPYKVKDKWFIKAKQQGYRARSAFKLIDIQSKYRLIKKGDTVLDLGAAPGSFMQAILKFIGDEGQVLGVDLQEIESFDTANAYTIQGDIFSEKTAQEIVEHFGEVNVVTSDLAPKTSGIRDVDQARSVELVEAALEISTKVLKAHGHFVAKVFEGEDFQYLLRQVKKKFKSVKCFKPPSCRDRSFETYIIAMDFKK